MRKDRGQKQALPFASSYRLAGPCIMASPLELRSKPRHYSDLAYRQTQCVVCGSRACLPRAYHVDLSRVGTACDVMRRMRARGQRPSGTHRQGRQSWAKGYAVQHLHNMSPTGYRRVKKLGLCNADMMPKGMHTSFVKHGSIFGVSRVAC